MFRLIVRLVMAATVSSLASSPARADSIDVTGGFLQGPDAGKGGTIQLSGERGFTLTAGVTESGGIYAPGVVGPCSAGCAPGNSLPLTAHWSGNDLPSTVTLDGVTYTNVGGLAGTAFASVDFAGVAALPGMLTPSAVITAPFTFTGLFSPTGDKQVNLFGSGTATIFLHQLSFVDGWGVGPVRYDFAGAPGEPIPEPATLLLVGAGVGGLILRRARRRREEAS